MSHRELASEYLIETRDCNGNRETRRFASRCEFLAWCEEVYETDEEETEIMLVIQLMDDSAVPVILYSGLGQVARLGWDELIGFLS